MEAMLEFLLAGTVTAATPLLLAAIGELVVERSGILNLSIEGMMALGAVVGFATIMATGSHWTALLAGGLAGVALSALFAAVVLLALGNQVATGIAIGILGLGLSGLVGTPYEGMTVAPMTRLPIPYLSDLPIVGPGLFDHAPLVYLAPVLAWAVWLTLERTKIGLVIRAVGEAPGSARAIGYSVLGTRCLAILFGGFTAGLAGAFISTVSATLWSDGMIAGRGWIVVALVVFATWRVGRLVLGAWLFGLATIAELLAQGMGIAVPSQLLTSIPYIATIVAISILSRDVRRMRLNAPASLGRTYNSTA